MSLHGVPRYALETHAPTCMQRVYPTSVKRVHVSVCVCIQVEEAKTSKRGKSKVDGWKRVWDFYGLPTFSTFSTSFPPSLSLSLFLFRCSIGIERGLRMPRATGGGKTPSFAHPLSTLHSTGIALSLPFLLILRRSLGVSFLLRGGNYRLKAILRLLWTRKRPGDFFVSRIVSRTTPCVSLFHPNGSFFFFCNARNGREGRKWQRKKRKVKSRHERRGLVKGWEKKGDTFTTGDDTDPFPRVFFRRRFKRRYPFTRPSHPSHFIVSLRFIPPPVPAFFG